ncbi:transketolase [bacterium]|nr:transketolase [bacterium]
MDLKLDLDQLGDDFHYWEKTKDLVDQLIDIILNYRQSGHPGGSRSKVHMLLSLMLSGVMRWDIRQPEKRFCDRFILSAGHTIPLVYCTLAVLNEALRLKYEQTKDVRFQIKAAEKRALYWEDLLTFRRLGGLSGHAEATDKTLFIKFNTGPSGHGGPAAAGQALALKRAGAGEVRVFFIEGEAGLTPGGVHETLNSAWGNHLDNLVLLVDWNDYGIDQHRVSESVYGTPIDWIGSHGWEVTGTEQGSDWASVTKTLLETAGLERNGLPKAAWFKTRKGRGYQKYDAASHGSPHGRDSEAFWATKKDFADNYGATFENFGGTAPEDPEALEAEFRANLKAVMDVLREDQDLVNYLADRLVQIGDSVPATLPGFRLGDGKKTPFDDPRVFDYEKYPEDLFAQPGTMAANRAALAKWGAWVNAFGAKEYDRPLILAASADLSGSTNIAGFAQKYGDFEGYGWYGLNNSDTGTLLPQEITEFANAGMIVGLASTNLAEDPENTFEGFWGACSTYGSFSYLKYGMMRLFSQMAQDDPLKLGKVIWIAGHSGPETADDSRTHFGIYSPGVTQLFPKGHVINLHPWEHNEVPVMLGAALAQDVPIVALHLTRPKIEIPDRQNLGMPSHFKAAKGAYVLRDYVEGKRKDGVVIVQGTSAVENTIKILPELNANGFNLKIVCSTSAELFELQSESYRQRVLSDDDKQNSMAITTQAKSQMHDWLFNPEMTKYVLSADWDDRWRTGGTLEEVLDEAHLSPQWLLKGISRFVKERSIG